MISQSELPTKLACETLGVRRTSYYRNSDMVSVRVKADEPMLIRRIERIIKTFSGYGYKRVTKELQRRCQIVNHKRTYRIMSENNLLVQKKKKFKIITTNSNHNLPVYKNLAKNMVVSGPNQLWVADITYIHLPGGYIYLAVIIDVYSRKCIGWELSRNIDTQLTLNALNMAIKKRKHMGLSGLVHHSDHGVQYAAHEYVNRLKKLSAKLSMSRKGNPYDNAFVESFIKTLKAEEVYIKEYNDINEAYKNIKKFIEVVYNKKRLHSSIGYLPPDEFEKENLNISTKIR